MIHTSADGYLRGQLLIATPALQDGCFDKSVIFLCEHSPEGAMGVVINRPIAHIRLGEILDSLDIKPEHNVDDLPVYFGGPVESHRGFVLHSDDMRLKESVQGPQGICLTAHVNMLKGMAQGRGPNDGFLALGYAGWEPGQLEAELESGNWLTTPATKELVFETPNEHKWSLAAASIGVDLARLSAHVGHA